MERVEGQEIFGQSFAVDEASDMLERAVISQQHCKMVGAVEPISIIYRAAKNKWKSASEANTVPGEQLHDLRWFGGVPTRQLVVVPDAWRWPAASEAGGGGTSLLNMHAPVVYKALVRKVKLPEWDRFSPSWPLPSAQQEGSLKVIWSSLGVNPKTSALAWRITQRALPIIDT